MAKSDAALPPPATTTDMDEGTMERQTSRLSRLLSRSSHADLPDGAEVENLVGPAPDGGWEAWLCVLGGFFQQFCVFGLSEQYVLTCADGASGCKWPVTKLLP